MKKILLYKVTVGLYFGHLAKENILNLFLSVIRNDFEMFRPVLCHHSGDLILTTAPGLSSNPRKTGM
jgi:hypothetical protein